MIYGSWDIKDKVLCHFGPFLPFDAPNCPKNQNFEKRKKHLEILSSYTCVPQMIIIWCMVPEILCTKDRTFCHFGLFFALVPPNNSEDQNFEKMEKTTGGIIILNMRTINENHMMYDSWDMEHDRQDFFLILDHFLPFYTPYPIWQPRKSKFWKNENSTWRYHHFTQVYHKWQSYDIWLLRYDVHQTKFFCHLGTFFSFLPPLTAWKMKNSKKWKKCHDISSFYTIAPKIMIICYIVPDIWQVTDVIVIFDFGLFFALLPP